MAWSGAVAQTGPWSPELIGDQTGRTYLVTGVTSGLGTHTARELLRRGARVVLAARSQEKLAETAKQLTTELGTVDAESLVVDLADQASIRRSVTLAERLGPIDVLVNNAGVMATPYHRTVDGLELQMATNHFGPFLFTGLLLPQLLASGNARVVTVSSNAHRYAPRPPLHDPRTPEPHYRRWTVYSQSKLANLLFTRELQRRATEKGLPLMALAAHPGYAATSLLGSGATAGSSGTAGRATASILHVVMRIGAQSAANGALPTLMAATADLPGGSYVGPGGLQQLRGAPKVVGSRAMARDEEAARRLWQISEETVGLRWP